MKHALNSRVKVIKGVDDTFDQSFLGMDGIVIDHNTNQMTGNTNTDPLYRVQFDLNTVPVGHPQYDAKAVSIQDFWFEELQLLTDTAPFEPYDKELSGE